MDVDQRWRAANGGLRFHCYRSLSLQAPVPRAAMHTRGARVRRAPRLSPLINALEMFNEVPWEDRGPVIAGGAVGAGARGTGTGAAGPIG